MLFEFFIIGSFGILSLMQALREFKQPLAFEQHVAQFRVILPALDCSQMLWTQFLAADLPNVFCLHSLERG